MIQLMAASECKKEMIYYTFGDKEFEEKLRKVYETLTKEKVTVGKLFYSIINYQKSFIQSHSFFEYLILCYSDYSAMEKSLSSSQFSNFSNKNSKNDKKAEKNDSLKEQQISPKLIYQKSSSETNLKKFRDSRNFQPKNEKNFNEISQKEKKNSDKNNNNKNDESVKEIIKDIFSESENSEDFSFKFENDISSKNYKNLPRRRSQSEEKLEKSFSDTNFVKNHPSFIEIHDSEETTKKIEKKKKKKFLDSPDEHNHFQEIDYNEEQFNTSKEILYFNSNEESDEKVEKNSKKNLKNISRNNSLMTRNDSDSFQSCSTPPLATLSDKNDNNSISSSNSFDFKNNIKKELQLTKVILKFPLNSYKKSFLVPSDVKKKKNFFTFLIFFFFPQHFFLKKKIKEKVLVLISRVSKEDFGDKKLILFGKDNKKIDKNLLWRNVSNFHPLKNQLITEATIVLD